MIDAAGLEGVAKLKVFWIGIIGKILLELIACESRIDWTAVKRKG